MLGLHFSPVVVARKRRSRTNKKKERQQTSPYAHEFVTPEQGMIYSHSIPVEENRTIVLTVVVFAAPFQFDRFPC
jgi:hypothetical protein